MDDDWKPSTGLIDQIEKALTNGINIDGCNGVYVGGRHKIPGICARTRVPLRVE